MIVGKITWTQNMVEKVDGAEKTKNNSGWYGLLFMILLAFLNPGEQKHMEVITLCLKNEAKKDISGKVATAFGFVDLAIELLPIKYNNYILFSFTTLHDKGPLTIGICGNVFVYEGN